MCDMVMGELGGIGDWMCDSGLPSEGNQAPV